MIRCIKHTTVGCLFSRILFSVFIFIHLVGFFFVCIDDVCGQFVLRLSEYNISRS